MLFVYDWDSISVMEKKHAPPMHSSNEREEPTCSHR